MIYLLFLLLLVPVSVGAKDLETHDCYLAHILDVPATILKKAHTECVPKKLSLAELVAGEDQQNCYEKMERAMRAAEFFSLLTFPETFQVAMDSTTINTATPYAYHFQLPDEEPDYHKMTPYGFTQTLNAKAGRAIVLWHEAKACWRQP